MEGPVSAPHHGLTTRELASAITELAGQLNAANRRWLALIAEFDRRVQEAESLSREERQQARRSVSYYFDDEDGSLVLKARLPAQAGMLVLRALEAALPELPVPPEDCEPRIDVPAGTSTSQRTHAPAVPPSARRADALAGRTDGLRVGDGCAAWAGAARTGSTGLPHRVFATPGGLRGNVQYHSSARRQFHVSAPRQCMTPVNYWPDQG